MNRTPALLLVLPALSLALTGCGREPAAPTALGSAPPTSAPVVADGVSFGLLPVGAVDRDETGRLALSYDALAYVPRCRLGPEDELLPHGWTATRMFQACWDDQSPGVRTVPLREDALVTGIDTSGEEVPVEAAETEDFAGSTRTLRARSTSPWKIEVLGGQVVRLTMLPEARLSDEDAALAG